MLHDPDPQPPAERQAPVGQAVLVVCPLKLLGLCAGAGLHQYPSPRLQNCREGSWTCHEMAEDDDSP